MRRVARVPTNATDELGVTMIVDITRCSTVSVGIRCLVRIGANFMWRRGLCSVRDAPSTFAATPGGLEEWVIVVSALWDCLGTL